MPKRRKFRLLKKLTARYGHIYLHLHFKTCRFREIGWHYIVDNLAENRSIVVMLWHRVMMAPLYFKRNFGVVPIIDTHSDGETLAQIGYRLGYGAIRGSSNRQSSSVRQELVEYLQNPGTIVAITPDGPRGPIGQIKIGALEAIQQTRAVIIPLGAAATRKRIFNSWDRFEQPKLFSRIAIVFGPPIELDQYQEMDLKQIAQDIAARLNETQLQAEREVQR
jgi:lysophospholipid acyltransferase (LPLAT)-like uncharacterized protein